VSCPSKISHLDLLQHLPHRVSGEPFVLQSHCLPTTNHNNISAKRQFQQELMLAVNKGFKSILSG